MQTDHQLQKTIAERLRKCPRLAHCKIQVQVRNGEVVLRGQVHDVEQRLLAYRCAEDMPGVARVRDRVLFKPNETIGERVTHTVQNLFKP